MSDVWSQCPECHHDICRCNDRHSLSKAGKAEMLIKALGAYVKFIEDSAPGVDCWLCNPDGSWTLWVWPGTYDMDTNEGMGPREVGDGATPEDALIDWYKKRWSNKCSNLIAAD